MLRCPERPTHNAMSSTNEFNPSKKYVRIIETHANGLVAFEFAVGEPELFVELLMASQAFDAFCAMHGVTPTHGRLPARPDSTAQEWDWSLHAAREQHTRHDDKA